MTGGSFALSRWQDVRTLLERTRGWAALHRPYRPAEGLAVLLLLAAVAFPHEYRPFLPAVLPLALVAPGVSRALTLWLATNALSFLLTPSCTGKVLLLLEGIFPAVGGNLLGSFFREAKTDVCWVLVGFGWPIALLGLAQWWAAKPAPWAWLSAAERWLLPTRITGSFGNPNLFAGFLLVLLPLEAGLLLREERLLRRGLATGSLLLHSLVLALTFSHGAWLAAVGTMVLFSLCLQRLRRRELLTLVALGGVLAPVLLNHPWGGTLSHRLRIYRGALGLFLKYPLGTGAGGFLAYYPHQAGAVVAAHCHNIILQIMVEQGVVGLAVFVYLLLSWFRQGRKLTAPKMAGFLALMGGQLLYGVVDYVWATPLLTALFWLAEGYCFGPGGGYSGVSPQIFLFGYYGYGNLGDELMADYYRTLLAELFPGLERRLLVGPAFCRPLLAGERPGNRWHLPQLAWSTRPGDLWVAGGGNLLQNATSRRSLYYYLSLLKLARGRGARVVLLGQGFGPLVGRLDVALARWVLARVDLVEARDDESWCAFRAMGLEPSRLYRGVDPLWDLVLPPAPATGDGLLLILRQPEFPALQRLAQAALAQGLAVKAVALAPSDEPFLKRACPRFYHGLVRDLQEFVAALAGVGLVASSRLHGLILAAKAGFPVVGIGGPPKIQACCRGLGQTWYAADDRELATLSLRRLQAAGGAGLSRRVRELQSQGRKVKGELAAVLTRLVGDG